ncbi:PREDICTED: cuticle protein 18.7-like [Dufourea novaeangliae]|uniref:cuticle protein 18.7-like n=1 Tax=Dufourea novaeangliae TaxID=178035 RepID=UPI0007673AAC|nr:PREDICTED: cuticle protein 18.7-like [Dufourea novaeangliae]
MKSLIIIALFCGLTIVEPGYLAPLVSYSYFGIPLAYDGRVLDTPEVAQAKAAHLATQAYEAARNTLGYGPVPFLTRVYTPAITHGAPIGPDGRVVDTPEVAEAKAAHLAAHALEAAKKLGMYPYGALAYSSIPYAYRYSYAAPLGSDGRVIDTPEVAEAKAAHLAAHAQLAAKVAGKL